MLPSFAARPQGGGTAPCDERAVFTAVVYALTSGCAWRHLPPTFGTSPATAHRRFTVWTEAGLWRRLHRAVLDELGARGEVDWTSAIVDAASVRVLRRIRRSSRATATGGSMPTCSTPTLLGGWSPLRHFSCGQVTRSWPQRFGPTWGESCM
ncbi:transposase [Streptomyces sp. NPDC002133]|uniref:transposase n=1 Tax=Streptomyces sp. NPDC002133 TaxID=3154409 RepID=UPI003332EF21